MRRRPTWARRRSLTPPRTPAAPQPRRRCAAAPGPLQGCRPETAAHRARGAPAKVLRRVATRLREGLRLYAWSLQRPPAWRPLVTGLAPARTPSCRLCDHAPLWYRRRRPGGRPACSMFPRGRHTQLSQKYPTQTKEADYIGAARAERGVPHGRAGADGDHEGGPGAGARRGRAAAAGAHAGRERGPHRRPGRAAAGPCDDRPGLRGHLHGARRQGAQGYQIRGKVCHLHITSIWSMGGE